MADEVTNQVLKIIAERQKEMHEQNQEDAKDNRILLQKIADDMHEVVTDIALIAKDVSDLKAWRERVADPWIITSKDNLAQATGAGKVVKFIWPSICAVGLFLAGWALKILSAMSAAAGTGITGN